MTDKSQKDARQSRQIGGLKTQNKFIRQDIKQLKTELFIVISCFAGILVALALWLI